MHAATPLAGDGRSVTVIRLTIVNVSWSRVVIGVGSARTVAVAARADRSWQPVMFDGLPWLPSGVYRSGTDVVQTGARAQRAAVADPVGYLPDPVRWISAAAVPLGGGTVTGVDVVAAVLDRVLDEAHQLCGRPLPETVVVVPPGWGPPRRALLLRAALQAGLAEPVLIPAAHAIACYSGRFDVPVAGWIAVCDLGTRASVTIVRRSTNGFEIVAELDADAGGDQIDSALVEHLAGHLIQATVQSEQVQSEQMLSEQVLSEQVPAAAAFQAEGRTVFEASTATAPDRWQPGAEGWPTAAGGVQVGSDAAVVDSASSSRPAGDVATAATSRAAVASAVVDQAAVRAAKEAACGGQPVLIPGSDGRPTVLVTAAQVQAVAGQVLQRVVELVGQAVRAAEVAPEAGTGLVLVGGSARVPGVGELFATGTGLPTRVMDRPDLAAVTAAATADHLAVHLDDRSTDRSTDHRAGHGGGGRADGPGGGRSRSGLAYRSGRTAGSARPAAQVSWLGRTLGWLSTVRLMVGPALPAAASVLLLIQPISSADTFRDDTWLVRIIHAGALMMAGVCVVVAAAAFAVAYGPVLLVPSSTVRPAVHAALERRAVATALILAAVLGVGAATAFALLAGGVYQSDQQPQWLSPWAFGLALGPTLAVAVPIAVCGIAINRAAPRPARGWTTVLTMPYRSAALGPAGMGVMVWAISIPYDPARTDLMMRGAGAALGIAIACLLVDRLLLQVLAAVPLTIGGVAVAADPYDSTVAGGLAVIWIVAAVWWWTRRAWDLDVNPGTVDTVRGAPTRTAAGRR